MTVTVKLMAYTTLGYSYWVGFYDTLQIQRPYLLTIPTIAAIQGDRNYLANHIGSMSCHIVPLIIITSGADTHTCIQTST